MAWQYGRCGVMVLPELGQRIAVGSLGVGRRQWFRGRLAELWAAQTPVHDLVSESVGPHSLGQQLRPAPQTSPWVANTETKFYAFGKRNLPGFLASNTTELRRPAHAFR
jgi:hypothetical protein